MLPAEELFSGSVTPLANCISGMVLLLAGCRCRSVCVDDYITGDTTLLPSTLDEKIT